MARLKDKVAVITGGCSGIGLATVERFVAEGACVLVADIQDGATVASRFDGNVHYHHCDVTQESDIAAAMDAAVAAFGGLDIVFNNAGAVGARLPLEDMTGDAWDATQALLLRSAALGIRYALPHLRARGGGAIINTASIAGLEAGWSPIAYAVAKAGVIQLTRVAAAELARYRVRVNAICPGYILTNIFNADTGNPQDVADRIEVALRQVAPDMQPVPAAGSPRHIADACVFLASDEAAFVNGTHLVVDGGLTVGPRHAWDPEEKSLIRKAISDAVRDEETA